MSLPPSITRRDLLLAGAAAVAAPAILRGADLTKEPVRLGHIGTGTRGWDLIKYTGAVPEAKVLAVCDVYGPHLKRGMEASGNAEVRGYADYRELLADPKIEAVVIAAPDHWHEQMVLDAVAAGKAIYCEKGLTTSIASAKRMRAAVRKSGTVFQLGHQGRQLPAAAEAGRLIREGRIGPVTLIHTGRYFNGTRDRAPWRWYGYYSWWERPDPAQVVKDLDWDRWLGPAPKIDFDEKHFWHWRCYWPYGTGQAGDLLTHETDQVQCVLGWGIPDTCACTGLNAHYDDGREVPDTWLAAYRFEKHACSLTFEGCMNSRREQPPEYIGKDGRLIFSAIGQSASRFWIYPDGPAFPHMGKMPEPTYAYDPAKGEKWPNHMDDFLQCARTGNRPKCHIDEAFIEIATALMSVESYRLRREVRWDPVKEEIT
ncbi:MAG: Gfo/Idh/MocA family oxidoreductase [Verrucomicrobiae bacterium]|nr:Gfo/Idh/MocA family oxidoreductase [Verrucomicrobiae bacterium]